MLSSLGKTEEAVPVWQQLVKVAPERVDGYTDLGMALLHLKRCREAVSSLESPVKLSPDWAPLQLNLGNAYLNTGDIDKSRSAFETALKLDSNPAILNDISYSLAERNTDLEKAKEYAEKAVRAEEVASATMQLSGLWASDLDHAPRLATFWDTLGWVYSRLNDLVPAEAYVKAAWTLNQRPVIGQHLGHVYEQQGKREQRFTPINSRTPPAPRGSCPLCPLALPLSQKTLPIWRRTYAAWEGSWSRRISWTSSTTRAHSRFLVSSAGRHQQNSSC